ncbi:hypothetical protein A0H76_1717 [Hepatospora eriocheir]|uniref:Uncharacterized protein n=1 Tax=Hepatospora eriocheir TaxID=1081669 RepID=A0A1X0QGN6_9MICR|nr:hypothetical protein A0H76_1717 [Hepatospora eriocheir]
MILNCQNQLTMNYSQLNLFQSCLYYQVIQITTISFVQYSLVFQTQMSLQYQVIPQSFHISNSPFLKFLIK